MKRLKKYLVVINNFTSRDDNYSIAVMAFSEENAVSIAQNKINKHAESAAYAVSSGDRRVYTRLKNICNNFDRPYKEVKYGT